MNEHGGGLRFSETNSGEDSEGSIWGMEGSSFFALIVGAAVSVGIMLTMFTSLDASFSASAGVAVVPLALTLVYVFGFKNGRPRGYALDVLELVIVGRHWAPDARRQPRHFSLEK